MEAERRLRAEYEKQRSNMIHLKIGEIPFSVREAVNTLRGNIQLSGYNLKSVAVTSSIAHEGKSSIAFQLAKSLAGLSKKCIYVDCDIRRSVFKLRYQVQGKPLGLSEYLCGKASLKEVVFHTEDNCLDILFTGAAAPNPSELLSGTLFSALLENLKQNYDYVVVDTPPINLVIDGAIVAKQCDGAVLVIESGTTERAQALRAKRQLEYAGVKLLGVVLNKVESKKSGYEYKYEQNEEKIQRSKKRRAFL